MIEQFSGEHAFLSNFYRLESGLTLEHYFQAAKTTVEEEYSWIMSSDGPGTAKRRGRRVTLRPDWEEIKVDVMRNLLREKFSQEDLRIMLLSTGDEELVEGNYWGDRFWGVCNGSGKNWLGKLLMEIRSEIRIKEALGIV